MAVDLDRPAPTVVDEAQMPGQLHVQRYQSRARGCQLIEELAVEPALARRIVQEHQRRDTSETAVTQAVASHLRLGRGAPRRWMFRLKSIDAAGPY